MARAISRRLFIIPGSKDVVKACGYVADLVESFLFINQETSGYSLYNFCFPTEYSIQDISSSISLIGNWKKPWSFPMKYFAPIFSRMGYPFSHLGARIAKLLISTKVTPKTLIDLDFHWGHTLHESLEEWNAQSRFDMT